MNQILKYGLISVLTVSLCPSTVLAEEWRYQFEPYAMITSIKGDAGVGQITGADVDVDFGTILDNLESAAMIHFEAHHDSGWGMAFDYGYMDLGGKKNNDTGSVNVEVRQGVFEAAGLYRTQLSNSTLDYFAGIRWWDNDISIDLSVSALPGDGLRGDVKSDWVDLVVGVRWLGNINKNWTYLAQADIGGLGLESDFTTSVQTGVQYQISDTMTLDMKYKATWVDFEEGDQGEVGSFQYDTVTHGPVIGLIFNF
jgi:hypothetical protein